MAAGSDNLTPHRRGERPSQHELASRMKLSMSRFGRLSRLRSWLTVIVAILAVIAGYLLLKHAS